MIKTEKDILYNRLKNSVGFHRSKKFKKWFHETHPNKQMHHIFGSFSQSMKTSDYCSVDITMEEHEFAEKDKSSFGIANLDRMLVIMQSYIKYLEDKCS